MNDIEYEKALLSGDQNTNIKTVKPKEKDTSSDRDDIISSIELREEVKNLPVPQFITTGHPLFDKYVPMKGGDFILLGGRAGEGKTQFCTSLTKKLAQQGKKCLWFSMELSAREFVERFREDLPLFYIPRKLKSNTLGWMEQKIDEGIKHHQIEVVFIDHLGMIADEATYQNANAQDIIKERVNVIKRWAVNKEICIIGISVVKQETNAKKGKQEFDLSDYKGSSDLAHTADTALIMQRIAGMNKEIALNDVLEDNLGMSTEADLHILKCRRTGIMKAKIRMIMDDEGNFSEM